MRYDLPVSVEVNGTEYEIRSDYRDILTIIEAISDKELTDQDKAEVMMDIFYPGFHDMPSVDYEEAIKQALIFINCGEEEKNERTSEKLMDWEQDFPIIVSPINRVIGQEVRALTYLHWWSWMSAYLEIGDCLFAQVVNIRRKKSKGEKLDKSEQEFYRKNRHLIDFQKQYTEQDEAVISRWI